MAKAKGLAVAVVAAAALTACGGRGPVTTGAEVAAPKGDGTTRTAERFGLLTAIPVCEPTCNAASGIADFNTQSRPTDALSYAVIDRTDGDVGNVSLSYEDQPYATQDTPINVVVTPTTVSVSGTFYGLGLSPFSTFSFTIDSASGGVKQLTLGSEVIPLTIQFFEVLPGACGFD